MNITAKAENGRAVISIKGQIAGWRDSEKNFTANCRQPDRNRA